jgi:hypothetical protein
MFSSERAPHKKKYNNPEKKVKEKCGHGPQNRAPDTKKDWTTDVDRKLNSAQLE